MRRYPVHLVIVSFAVLAAIGLGVTLAGNGSQGDRGDQVSSRARPPLESVWRGLHQKGSSEASPTQSLRALRGAFRIMRGPPEAVPLEVQRHIRATLGAAANEFRFEETQFTPASGGVWIISGENVTCVSQRGVGGFACDTTTRFARNGMALGVGIGARGSVSRPREFLVQGAAPDWARVARMQVNGRIRSITIENNTYRLRAKERVMLDRLER
jgi:hypothetical protein